MKEKKLSFFKKLKTSIFDFDGYQELAAENISRTIGYIVLLMLIFSILTSLAFLYNFSQQVADVKDYINNEISEIKYENYQLTVIPNNGEEITEYNIEIEKINLNDKTKNIVFKITDENLLNKTGGIVQGMSGSPIIQDNKIIGAVTHVIVNDCTKGYGIFITNMLEEAEN